MGAGALAADFGRSPDIRPKDAFRDVVAVRGRPLHPGLGAAEGILDSGNPLGMSVRRGNEADAVVRALLPVFEAEVTVEGVLAGVRVGVVGSFLLLRRGMRNI